MSLVPVHSLAQVRGRNTLRELSALLLRLADQADQLAQAEDINALADGLFNLRGFRQEVTDLERHIESRLADVMPADVVNVDDDIVLERRRGNVRKSADWGGIMAALRVATAADENGVLLSPQERAERYAAALEQVAPLTASVPPRAGAMRDRGLNPDEFTESKPGRVSVSVRVREDNQ